MPFLRRRGVMASDNDMRRHSTLLEDSLNTAPPLPKSATMKPDFLRPNAFAKKNSTVRDASNGENGDLAKVSLETTDPTGDEITSLPVPMGRHSEDPGRSPDSPPLQPESNKHRRFSMLRFRTASDSQLATRSRLQHQQQQQAEKPPPLPQRMFQSLVFPLPPFDFGGSGMMTWGRPCLSMRRGSQCLDTL
jgi:hypothetical protein